jgi:Spy/CpxP family protein refolding chaperone
MRFGLKTALILGLAGWLTSAANGQPPFGRGGGFGGPGMLLQNSGVQKELKLSEEQIQKIKGVIQEIQKKHQDDFAALANLEQQERREKMQEIFKSIGEETEKGMADVLKPEQSKRLKQIVLQTKGTQAFGEEDVQKSLNLTDDQKDKIKTLNEDLGKDIRETFQNSQGNFQETGKKVSTLRKETMDKVLALLTDDQKKSWKDMTGDPFELKFEGGPRGGFGAFRGPPPPPAPPPPKDKAPSKKKEKDNQEKDKQ